MVLKTKRKKNTRQKSKGGKILFSLILIGIGLVLLFHQQIFRSVKPLTKRRSALAEKKEILLYFSDSEGEYLVGEKRKILRKNAVQDEAKEVIVELIKGPNGSLIRTLPPRTELLNLEISNAGVARVSFTPALSKDHPGGSSAEMMTVYSIVNSLSFNFAQIKRVQILIDGKPISTIVGHLSLEQPVSPKPDLIKKQ
ncbi:MAG TPA: GerMN domain-containing protein [Thermodesulfobacteriota bacterium]|jgi:spore germination protein GerM|nr:GerMN domain-containing protein [Thermodesulfobacteriota bacterium]